MSVRAHKPTRGARRRSGAPLGNSAAGEPRSHPDATELVSAEKTNRAADYQEKVAMAAYFIAEKRGFEPGHELDDWLLAEAQIAAAELPSVISSSIQAVEGESIS